MRVGATHACLSCSTSLSVSFRSRSAWRRFRMMSASAFSSFFRFSTSSSNRALCSTSSLLLSAGDELAACRLVSRGLPSW